MSVDGRALGFTELAAGTRALTGRMRALGIGQGDRVAVCAPNSLDTAVAVLGVMRAAACAPLNPQYPRSELDFFLDDLDARAMVVTRDSPAAARDAAVARGLPLIEAGAAIWAESSAEASMPSPDDVALVLHTSGTTSRPKQVPLSHANLMASMAHIADALALSMSDRALNMMPLFHIHGLLAGLLAPLAAGGSAICAPGLQLPDALEWLDRLRPTWYSAVPTIHQSIVAAAQAAGHRPRRKLRLVRSSSAALAPSTLRALEALFGCPVIDAYGMTEASHQMTSNPLPPAKRKPGSVGLPAGPEVTVLDSAGKPVAAGVRGEIAIRGANVMSSYHRNPEANRSAFVAGWFKTGDEGYFDGDGYLHLTGRLKEMISRGGEKIAPRDIDEALLTHPGVAQAVAFAVPHETLGEDVVAAVVLQPGSRADAAQLRAHLFERLAAFKVPSEVLVVDEIPRGRDRKDPAHRNGLAAGASAARGRRGAARRDRASAGAGLGRGVGSRAGGYSRQLLRARRRFAEGHARGRPHRRAAAAGTADDPAIPPSNHRGTRARIA